MIFFGLFYDQLKVQYSILVNVLIYFQLLGAGSISEPVLISKHGGLTWELPSAGSLKKALEPFALALWQLTGSQHNNSDYILINAVTSLW